MTTSRTSRGLYQRSGQSITESLFLLPIFLAVTFFVIQIGQLGMALMVVNYGASKVAHQAVADNVTSPGQYKSLLDSIMIAGMKTYDVTGSVDSPSSQTRTLTVTASAKVPALPFIGEIFHKALKTSAAGPVQLSDHAPYFWIVSGSAQARMNFRP